MTLSVRNSILLTIFFQYLVSQWSSLRSFVATSGCSTIDGVVRHERVQWGEMRMMVLIVVLVKVVLPPQCTLSRRWSSCALLPPDNPTSPVPTCCIQAAARRPPCVHFSLWPLQLLKSGSADLKIWSPSLRTYFNVPLGAEIFLWCTNSSDSLNLALHLE